MSFNNNNNNNILQHMLVRNDGMAQSLSTKGHRIIPNPPGLPRESSS